jgi:hypothetical protein
MVYRTGLLFSPTHPRKYSDINYKISPHISPYVRMTPPHMIPYIDQEETNDSNGIKDRPNRRKDARHTMSETHASTENFYEPGLYEIRIKSHLDDRRAAGFESMTVTREENGCTLLTGRFDQAALHGLLRKVRDLGMPLVSVTRVQFDETHPDRSKTGDEP